MNIPTQNHIYIPKSQIVERKTFIHSEYVLCIYVFTMLIALLNPMLNNASNLFGMIAFVFFLVECLLIKSINLIRLSKPLIGIMAFTGLTMLSFIHLPEAISLIRRSLLIFFLLAYVFLVVRISGRLTSISWGFGIGILLLTPIVFTQAVLLQDTTQRLKLGLGSDDGSLNPNGYGIMLNICIILWLYEIYTNKEKRRGLIRFITIIFGLSIICISAYQIIFYLGSRQNQLWLILTVIGVGLIATKGKLSIGKLTIGGCMTIALTTLVVYSLRNSPHIERILFPINSLIYGDRIDASTDGRIAMIQTGLQLFLDSPIWGHGIAGFQIKSGFGTYSHNMFIETLVNYGILGFILFFSYYIVTIIKAYNIFKYGNARARTVSLWIFLAFSGILISHIFRPIPYDKPMFILLGSLGGICYYIYSAIQHEGAISRIN